MVVESKLGSTSVSIAPDGSLFVLELAAAPPPRKLITSSTQLPLFLILSMMLAAHSGTDSPRVWFGRLNQREEMEFVYNRI